ncbi:hypothetical protein ACIQNU_38380 [Streptomyces sp. NPDC091292]|uniref:hypothetical protein n=1 Tax=Streptomyces sp. NPDC091292 TaxID=3365991 RepID=UPI0037F42591
MARPPTAAQLRLIRSADPVTGRLRGTETQLVALVRLRLAFRHPRPPHDWFLTPAGHAWRDRPADEPVPVPEPAPEPPAAPSRVFAARVGGEPSGDGGPARAREVHSAWQGLLEMRRMTHPDGAVDRPCAWERTHLIPAAALALEAAGCRPAGTGHDGYRVTGTAQPEAVAVHAPDPSALLACAAALEAAGWQAGEYTDPRRSGGRRYLLASPRRV